MSLPQLVAIVQRVLEKFGIDCDADTFYHIHACTDHELKRGVKYDLFFDQLLR
jgi:hypothetical protein